MIDKLATQTIKTRNRMEAGQGMPEYAMIAVLVALACLLAFTNLGSSVMNKIYEIAAAI